MLRPSSFNVSSSRPLIHRRTTSGDGPRIARRRFFLYSYTPASGWALNPAVTCVELEHGRLFVGGVQVVKPRITHDHIAWTQHSRHGNATHYTSGALFLHSNGIDAHGHVSLGPDRASATHHDVLATTIPTVHYQTQVTHDLYPKTVSPEKLPASAWTEGLTLEVTYQQQIGNAVPTPVVRLDGQDISAQCAWSVTDNATVLGISLSDSDCLLAGGLYADATLAFDALIVDAPGSGAVRRVCGEPAPDGGSVRFWKTEAPVVAQRRLGVPLRRLVTEAHLIAPVANDGLDVRELMTLLPDDVVNDDANSMLMRNMKWAMGQNSTENDWLAKFFNEAPPAIVDDAQRALATQGLDWYQNKFAKAYLTHSFNDYVGPNQPTHRLDPGQTAKLDAYLRSGLASEKDFSVQHQGIFVEAYVAVKTRLGDYLRDTAPEQVGWAQGEVAFTRGDTSQELTIPSGLVVTTAAGVEFVTQAKVTIPAGQATSTPVAVEAAAAGPLGLVAAQSITQMGNQTPVGVTSVSNPRATTLQPDTGGLKWAKKLFTALTTGSQFVLMVNRVAAAAGDAKALGPVNNFACLLTALDRSGDLASSYFQSIMSGVIVKLVPSVVHRDRATTMQWLPATMEEMFRKLANGELPNEADISKAEGQEMYEVYLKNAAEIAGATADLLQSIVASGLIAQAKGAEAGFATSVATRWPKLAKASKFMVAIGWIGGVTSVIVSLSKGEWKSMNDKQKAEFVTNCTQLAVVGFDAVPLIWSGAKNLTLTVWNKLSDWWNGSARQSTVEIELEELGGEEAATAEAGVLEPLIQAAKTGSVLGKGTIFERIFADGVFSGVLKVVGAVAAAAMAAYSLWQLIDDVQQHGSVSTIVFDALVFTANFLSAVCLVADLFVATSFLPIAGAVLALAGILIGFLAGFFEKPANPLDQWMDDFGIPFASGLPAPAPA